MNGFGNSNSFGSVSNFVRRLPRDLQFEVFDQYRNGLRNRINRWRNRELAIGHRDDQGWGDINQDIETRRLRRQRNANRRMMVVRDNAFRDRIAGRRVRRLNPTRWARIVRRFRRIPGRSRIARRR